MHSLWPCRQCSWHLRPSPTTLLSLVLQIGGGFCLHPDNVFLLSARDALLSRLVLSGRAEGEDRRAFMLKAFGKRWGRGRARAEEEVREEAEEMLKVGILSLLRKYTQWW